MIISFLSIVTWVVVAYLVIALIALGNEAALRRQDHKRRVRLMRGIR